VSHHLQRSGRLQQLLVNVLPRRQVLHQLGTLRLELRRRFARRRGAEVLLQQ
jgi:hypothetical protein